MLSASALRESQAFPSSSCYPHFSYSNLESDPPPPPEGPAQRSQYSDDGRRLLYTLQRRHLILNIAIEIRRIGASLLAYLPVAAEVLLRNRT